MEKILHPEVNRRLRAIRKTLDKSQVEFCRLINAEQANYSRIENGLANIPTWTLYDIIFLLKVSPNYLILGEGAMFQEDVIPSKKHSVVTVQDNPEYYMVNVKIPKNK